MKREINCGLFLMALMVAGVAGCATPETSAVSDHDLVLSGKMEDGVRVIQVAAMQYKFDPDPIVVALGDKVRLMVTSKDVAHGLAIDEFKVNVVVDQKAGKMAEFTAGKKGTFEIHCSVFCGFGHFGMHGKLVVK